MVDVVLEPFDDRHAAALAFSGCTVSREVTGGEPVVVVARRDAIGRAVELAVARREAVAALVLIDPEEAAAPDRLAAVAAPTLLIAAPGDPARPIRIAESYWRHIPTSRLIVETPGDVRLWERPADLAARVQRFLREVLA